MRWIIRHRSDYGKGGLWNAVARHRFSKRPNQCRNAGLLSSPTSPASLVESGGKPAQSKESRLTPLPWRFYTGRFPPHPNCTSEEP